MSRIGQTMQLEASSATSGSVLRDVTCLAVFVSIPFMSSWAKLSISRWLNRHPARQQAVAQGKVKQRRRRFKPNKQLLGLAWSVIYLCMGLAAWLVWRAARAPTTPLLLYAALLVVNCVSWPPLFAGGHRLRSGFADAAALLVASLATIISFYRVSSAAGLLLLPFLGWTCFATTLINCSLMYSNPAVLSDAERLVQIKPQERLQKHRRNATCPAYLSELASADLDSAHNSDESPQPPEALLRAVQRPPQWDGSLQQAWDRVAARQQPQQPARGGTPRAGRFLAGPSPSEDTERLHEQMPAQDGQGGLPRRVHSLGEMSMGGSGSDSDDAGHLIIPNEYVDHSMRQAQRILSRVSSSIMAAAETVAPSLMTPMTQLLGQMSLGLGGGALEEVMEEVAQEWRFDGVQTDSIDPAFFTDPGANGWKVRGPEYLVDRKKVLADEPVCCLASVNLAEVQPTFHIARFLPSIKDSRAPFTFVLQIMVPGKTNISLTIGWSCAYDPIARAAATEGRQPAQPAGSPCCDASAESFSFAGTQTANAPGTPRAQQSGELAQACTPFDRCLQRFAAGSDDGEADVRRRHGTFKLIPKIDRGSWVIRNAVGSTPVLLGKKLTTKYFRGPRYFEVDIDVGSSSTAASVVGMVQGALKGLVIDMAIVLEGHTGDELPEALLGTVRLNHLDLDKAAVLNLETGVIRRKDLTEPCT